MNTVNRIEESANKVEDNLVLLYRLYVKFKDIEIINVDKKDITPNSMLVNNKRYTITKSMYDKLMDSSNDTNQLFQVDCGRKAMKREFYNIIYINRGTKIDNKYKLYSTSPFSIILGSFIFTKYSYILDKIDLHKCREIKQNKYSQYYNYFTNFFNEDDSRKLTDYIFKVIHLRFPESNRNSNVDRYKLNVLECVSDLSRYLVQSSNLKRYIDKNNNPDFYYIFDESIFNRFKINCINYQSWYESYKSMQYILDRFHGIHSYYSNRLLYKDNIDNVDLDELIDSYKYIKTDNLCNSTKAMRSFVSSILFN